MYHAVAVEEGTDPGPVGAARLPGTATAPPPVGTHVAPDGRRTELVAWRGLLWSPLRVPGGDHPLTERDLIEVLAAGRFAGTGALDVPTARDGSPRLPRLASLAGIVHAATGEPAHAVATSPAGVTVEPAFLRGRSGSWRTFRADRLDDALAFARLVADRGGAPFLGRRGSLDVDTGGMALHDDAFRSMNWAFSASFAALGVSPDLRDRLNLALAGRTAFPGPDVAEDAYAAAAGLLDAVSGLPDPTPGACLAAAVARFDDVDRRWLARAHA